MKSIIKLLSDCQTKRADKVSNGYYIVTEFWNTCFHRWASKITNRIEVRISGAPKCIHTYTRIPTIKKNNIYIIYVNIDKNQGFKIILPKGSIIVGGYEPQPSGDYNNYSYLVFSETSEPPTVEEFSELGVYVQHEENIKLLETKMICPPEWAVKSYKLRHS